LFRQLVKTDTSMLQLRNKKWSCLTQISNRKYK